jgi:uncharacterized protein
MKPAAANSEVVAVKVKPRASRAGIELSAEGELVVRVHAPAAENAANEECCATVARALDVPKSAVVVARGQKSRTKQLAVEGLPAGEARQRLEKSAEKRGKRE